MSLLSYDGPDEAFIVLRLDNTGVAQRKRAGLILVTPDRNGSPVLLHFVRFTEATRLASDVKCSQTPCYRCGAEEARKAHNLEDT